MDIDIHDYVNKDEIKEAILDGLRGYSRDNAERVISNCGHYLATDIVNENLGADAAGKIAEKAAKVIGELSAFTIFDGGGCGRAESAARKSLNNAVRENKDALTVAVRHAIHNLSKRDVIEVIKAGKVKLVVE